MNMDNASVASKCIEKKIYRKIDLQCPFGKGSGNSVNFASIMFEKICTFAKFFSKCFSNQNRDRNRKKKIKLKFSELQTVV